jgi:hypothetical protein
MPGPAPLDLLELAEDVAFGRRTLDNVIDQIAVAVPEDRARRRAVAELESLILGLTGVRAHARATAAASSPGSRPAVATDLVVEPRRVRQRGGLFGTAGAFAAGLTAIAGVVIVAVVVASLRPSASVGGPSPSLPNGAVVGSSSPGPSEVASPNASSQPSATVSERPQVSDNGGPLVFWTRADGSLTLWRWNPSGGSSLERWLTVDTWPSGGYPMQLDITVLVAPGGNRFAVHEHRFGDPASHDRTRVFDGAGKVIWTVPDGQPMTLEMAWSADGSAIALGTTDGHWGVVYFSADGAIHQDVVLPNASYRLLGFDTSGLRLFAVAKAVPGGDIADPATVDLVSGRVTALEAWPSGIVPATTTAAGAISPAGGLVLARSGQAWVQRTTTGEARVDADASAQIGWVGGRTIAVLTPAPKADPAAPLGPDWLLTTTNAADGGKAAITTTLTLHRGDQVVLASTNGSTALVGARVGATYPGGDPGWRDFTLVDTATGAKAAVASPDPSGTLGAGLWFAGWTGPTMSTPTRSPQPTTAPTALPATPPASPTPGATAAAGLPPIVNQLVDGPATAWWSLIAPDRIAIWRWDPASGGRMTEMTTLDTWAGDAIQRTVLLSPDGTTCAFLEVDSRTSSPVQRLRIVGLQGRLTFEAPRLPLVTSMAWAPDSTSLAVGSLPVPWTVFHLDGVTVRTTSRWNLDDRDGYALLGWSQDGTKLYGYGTGGEAEFWQKPVVLDLASGDITHPATFPGGVAALAHGSATAPVDAVRSDGSVLAMAGSAKGDLHWVIRDSAGTETSLAIGNDAQVAWGSGQPDDATLMALSRVPVSDDHGLAVRRLDATGTELPGAVALPDGAYNAVLVGVRGSTALVSLTPIAAQGDPQPVREAALVDTATGTIAVGLPPAAADGAGFTFGGWLPAQ